MSTAIVERGFSSMNVVKDERRSQLGNETLNDLLEVKIHGSLIANFVSEIAFSGTKSASEGPLIFTSNRSFRVSLPSCVCLSSFTTFILLKHLSTIAVLMENDSMISKRGRKCWMVNVFNATIQQVNVKLLQHWLYLIRKCDASVHTPRKERRDTAPRISIHLH